MECSSKDETAFQPGIRVLRIRGRVSQGLGEGGFYVEKYAEEFGRTLGFKPFPGTLNIEILNGVLSLHECKGIEIKPPSPSYGLVLAYPACLNGEKVFIIKPLLTRHSSQIIEIISSFKLREVLGLKNGDVVEVRVFCREDRVT
jgi:riboflavin kinase